jgi:hypothetical protein
MLGTFALSVGAAVSTLETLASVATKKNPWRDI